MPDDGGKPGGSDKPGLELFKSLAALTERANQLKEKGFDLEFVLASYKENH